jgi:diguanylate cyclase (GGDEF)-like protein/PAS domain S-box-containing protein
MSAIEDKIFLLEQCQKQINLGVWEYKKDENIFTFSAELIKILDIDTNKIYDLEIIKSIVIENDHEKIMKLFEDALNFDKKFTTTFRHKSDNKIKHYSIYCDINNATNNKRLYGFIQDITEEKIKSEEQERLINITDEHVIISQTDLNGVITYASQAFCNISGYKKEELIGNNHNILRHKDMKNKVFKNMWKTIQEGKKWEGDVKNKKKDGGFYWVHSYVSPIKDYNNKIIGYQSLREDITDKKYIEEISITDALTTLYNRRHFNEMLKREINHSRRTSEKLVFVMMDVDFFKKYNDTYGHQKGDKVLQKVSKSLLKTFRRSHDMVFRLGGEEFGILFSLKDETHTLKLVEKARKNIEKLQIEHKLNNPKVITASFGVLKVKNNHCNSIEEEMELIYHMADKLLYKAKKKGRNRVEIK